MQAIKRDLRWPPGCHHHNSNSTDHRLEEDKLEKHNLALQDYIGDSMGRAIPGTIS